MAKNNARPFFFTLLFIGISFAVQAGEQAAFLPPENDAGELYGSGQSGMLDVYQRVISPVKGGNTCPMHPSCSQYAKIAFENLDPLSAFLASADRYVRCGRDRDAYPLVAVDNMALAYDPVASDTNVAPPPSAIPPRREIDSGCCDFADALLAGGDFLLAELEFRRVMLSSPSAPCRRQATIGLAKSAYRFDNLDRFINIFFTISDTLKTDSAGVGVCGLLLAKRYFSAERYDDALGVIAKYAGASALHDERLFLESLSLLSMGDSSGAVRAADSISPAGPLGRYPSALDQMLPDLHRGDRSPLAAGILSTVIPGAGYLYAGRPQTAFASLLINGLFAWGAYDFFSHRLYGAGATAALLGSGFYLGGIRGSVLAASKHNGTQFKRRISILIEKAGYRF